MNRPRRSPSPSRRSARSRVREECRSCSVHRSYASVWNHVVREIPSFFIIVRKDVQRLVSGCAASFHFFMSSSVIVCRHLSRSEEHTPQLQSLMRISYAAFCLQTHCLHITTTISTHQL